MKFGATIWVSTRRERYALALVPGSAKQLMIAAWRPRRYKPAEGMIEENIVKLIAMSHDSLDSEMRHDRSYLAVRIHQRLKNLSAIWNEGRARIRRRI